MLSIQRHKNFPFIFILWIVIQNGITTIFATDLMVEMRKNFTDHSTGSNQEGRSLFNPKIDYNNKWTPVGRGDPLNNDPTYDYSPPVLDRVQYWGGDTINVNTTSTTTAAAAAAASNAYSHVNPNKQDILVLGVSSTKRALHRNVDANQMSIRRNYHTQLPTVLMPPPIHPLGTTSNYKMPGYYSNQFAYADSSPDESMSYVQIAKPNTVSTTDPYNAYATRYQSSSKKPWIHALLHKEVTKPATTFIHSAKYTEYSTVSAETSTHFTPTIPPASSSSSSSLTSSTTSSSIGELFEHATQLPAETKRSAFLIIQGHSKVKTYGQTGSAEKPIPKIVPVQSVDNPIVSRIIAADSPTYFQVKHLHPTSDQTGPDNNAIANKSNETITIKREQSKNGLLSLLNSSFGDFLLTNENESNKALNLNVNEISKDRKINYQNENNVNVENKETK